VGCGRVCGCATIAGMGEEPLARRIGHLLRTERQARRMSQKALAHAAGTTQQCVSQLETGRFAPTTSVIERAFAALGWRLRLDVEPLDAELDAELARAGEQTAEEVELVLADLGSLLRRRPKKLRYLVDGELAARLHGVMVPVRSVFVVAVAEADMDRLARWILSVPNCLRYNERWRDYSNYDIDPTRRGPLRWRTPFGELAARLLPALPEPVNVRVGERTVPLRPLADVERDHPAVARVLRRLRATSGHRPA
jgi:transcriptional regulator with XRE-family HTH domain